MSEVEQCPLCHQSPKAKNIHTKFNMGELVCKSKGSGWHGTIVGRYSTSLTPEGYCVESYTEHGSVQIYPASALELWTPSV